MESILHLSFLKNSLHLKDQLKMRTERNILLRIFQRFLNNFVIQQIKIHTILSLSLY